MTAAAARKPVIFEFDEDVIIPTFRPYIHCDKKIQLFTGPAGSGKSEFLIRRCIIYCLSKKYFRLLYGRKVFKTIRGSSYQAFVDVITGWGLQNYFSFNVTTMTITCYNGNKMIAYGLDDVKKIKSIKDISHVFIDEMSDIDQADFSQLRIRLRTQKVKKPQFWGAFNPVYEFKWGREHFFADPKAETIPLGEVPSRLADTLIFKSHYKDNPFIDYEEYTAMLIEEAKGDQNNLRVYANGDWGKSNKGNEYYRTFNLSTHVKQCKFVPGLPIHLTWDFNWMPYVALGFWQLQVVDGRTKVRCLGSVAKFSSIEQTCRYFEYEYGHLCTAGVFYYGDASGANSNPTEVRNHYNLIDGELANLLFEDSRRLLTQNQRHKAIGKDTMGRRELMAKLFSGSMGVDVEIDPVNTELVEDLDRIRQDGNSGKEKKKIKVNGQSFEELGHMSDGMDGFFGWMFGELNKRVNDQD